MTRRDWAGRWGPTLDGLCVLFMLIGLTYWIICGGNR